MLFAPWGYHYIRRTNDRICKEQGLSVIIPGQDKGKSYIEHQAAQAGTSYKAKLKAAIDHLIPASADFDDLLLHPDYISRDLRECAPIIADLDAKMLSLNEAILEAKSRQNEET